MKKKNNIKQLDDFYIKDEAFSNIDKDFFRYKDQSENIIDIICKGNFTPPYNIAIIGKWGIGKTTLINFIKPKINNKFHIIEISAWKYEKEAIRKVFLKRVHEGLTKRKNTTFDMVKDFFFQIFESSNKKGKLKTIIRKWKCELITIILFSIALYLIPAFIDNVFLNSSFIFRWKDVPHYIFTAISGYIHSLYLTLTIPTLFSIFIVIIDKMQRGMISVNILETSDDYETLLKKHFDNMSRQNKNKPIVVILDDIDRLSMESIRQALDAIKTFMDLKNFIFIVPFDDSIIKEALDRRASGLSEEERIIKSELILDKLFQFKVYLPPILPRNLKKYALEMALDSVSGLVKMCGEDNFRILMKDILIHNSIYTPRQIKKIINIFANNLITMKKRTEAQSVENDLLDLEGLKILAKVSVLQADFNEFYDALFINSGLIEEALEAHYYPKEYNSLQIGLKRFFEKSDEDRKGYIKKEYEPLINFLKDTTTVSSRRISAYLFLNQDEYSIKYSSEVSERITNAVESGNDITVKRILEEYKNINEDLFICILEESESTNLAKVLFVMYKIIDQLNFISENLYNLISRKTDELFKLNYTFEDCLQLSFDSIFQVHINSSLKNSSENLLEKHMNLYFLDLERTKKEFLPMISKILQSNDNISKSLKIYIKKILISKIFDEKTFQLDEVINSIPEISKENIITDYIDFDFLDKTCQYIIENPDSLEVKVWFEKCFSLFYSEPLIFDRLLHLIIRFYEKKELLSYANSIIIKHINRLKENEKYTILRNIATYDEYAGISNDIVTIIQKLDLNIIEEEKDYFIMAFDKLLILNINITPLIKNLTDEEIFLIPKTIDNILIKSLKVETYDSLILKLKQNINNENILTYISNLKNYISHIKEQEYIFNRVHQSVKNIIDIKNEKMKEAFNKFVVENLIPQIEPNGKIIIELSNIIIVIRKILYIENASLFINKLLEISLPIEFNTTIKVILMFKDSLDIETIKKISTNLNGIINAENYQIAFELVESIIEKHKSSEILDIFEWFFVEKIDLSHNINKILILIEKKYNIISNLNILIKKIVLYNHMSKYFNKNTAKRVILKYLRNKDENDGRVILSSLMKKPEYNKEQILFFFEIISFLPQEKLKNIFDEFISSMIGLSDINLMNIFYFIIYGFHGKAKRLLLKNYFEKIVEIDNQEFITKFIEKLNGDNQMLTNNERKDVREILASYIQTVNSDSLKAEINTFLK